MKYLTPQVKQFAEEAPDLVKMFSDYYNRTRTEKGAVGLSYDSSLSKDELSTAINKAFVEVVGKQSKYTLADFGGQVAQYAQSPMVRTFADSNINMLVDMILPDIKDSALGLIADFRFGGFNDSFTFKLKNNGLLRVSKAGYRQRTTPAQRLYDTEESLIPVNHQVTVQTTFYDIITGRDSLAEQVMRAILSIKADMIGETIEAFKGAFTAVTVPTQLKIASYTEDDLIKLCQTVTAWNFGERAIIVGSPIALKDVLPLQAGVNIMLTDDFVVKGYLPMFNGYQVVPLDPIADYASSTYGTVGLDDNLLYVVSPANGKLVKVAVGGSLTRTDALDRNANLDVETTISKEYATKVITNAIGGTIALS